MTTDHPELGSVPLSTRLSDSEITNDGVKNADSAQVGKSWRGTFFKKISTTFSQIIFNVNKLATWLFSSKNETSKSFSEIPETPKHSITLESKEFENNQLSELENKLKEANRQLQEAVKKLQKANDEVSNLRAKLEVKPIEVKPSEFNGSEQKESIGKDQGCELFLNEILPLVNNAADIHPNVTPQGLQSFLNYLKNGIFSPPIPKPPGPPPAQMKSINKSFQQVIKERKAQREGANTSEDQPAAQKKSLNPPIVPSSKDVKLGRDNLRKVPLRKADKSNSSPNRKVNFGSNLNKIGRNLY